MAGGVDELSAFLIKQTGVDECAEREEKQALRGAYGFVFKVTVQGVERIGKKLHSAYVNNVSDREKQVVTSRFRDECVILSKLRHPNIVQFIGVHYGRRGKTDLTLIMECVRSDMQEFLEGHPNLPLPVKLSILLDVSYGLVYLHEWDPNTPIVHRDLTARNVLITDKCQAKIADLGMAKVVDIQAQMAVSHTQTPGQMFYMPPEALMEKASCTPKLDIFSFGHLTLFTVNQEFPKVYNVILTMNIQKQGVIEKLKRQRSLDRVGDDHCLYSVITDCLSDQPENRPTTRVLNNRMVHLSTLNPARVESVLEVFPSKTQRDAQVKLMAEVERLNSIMEQLYKHNKDQSKIVYQFRQSTKLLEDERDKLKERAQQELIQCKQEKSKYEGQVMELTKRLSLFEGKVVEQSSRASGVSGHGLEAEVTRLQLEVRKKDETIAKQNGQLSKFDSMVGHFAAMITYNEKTSLAIKSLTEKNDQLEEENAMLAESRDAISGDVAELEVEMKRLREEEDVRDKLKEDFLSAREEIETLKVRTVDLENKLQYKVVERSSQASGVSGRGLEAEVTRLQLEVRKKDETIAKQYGQLSKFKSMAGNLTAMMTYNEKTSLAIKALIEKNEQLEEENAMLAESRDTISGDMAELEVEMKRLKEVVNLPQQSLPQVMRQHLPASRPIPRGGAYPVSPSAASIPIQGRPAGNRGSGGKKRDVTASSTEKVFVKGIDNEIEAMAAVVQDEVSQDNKYKETQDLTPLDPNLVCPLCGKEHHIGEIQKFKIHVDKCANNTVLN